MNDVSDDRVAEALRLLLDLARERVDRHPLGHLLPSAGGRLDLRLELPLSPYEGALEETAQQLAESIDHGVAETLAQAAVFRPGRVFCLRCQSADCEHAAPTDSREIFAGFGATGAPRFVDFGEFLLERRDPRVEQLFDEESHQPVTTILGEDDLSLDLLPAFRDPERDYRIHGQVAAGWWRIPDETGRGQAVAVSILAISARRRGQRRRFGLNVVGQGPGGESLERLHDRLGAIPWTPAVRWGQSVLNRIAVEARGPGAGSAVERRIQGMLTGLARRLDRTVRARDRRTQHAEERHTGGERPTRMAIIDLSRAEDANILFDTRRQTLVVLGERGRTHLFNRDGKLVSSVRYPPHTIARRRETGLWRPATAEEAAGLRARVAPQPT